MKIMPGLTLLVALSLWVGCAGCAASPSPLEPAPLSSATSVPPSPTQPPTAAPLEPSLPTLENPMPTSADPPPSGPKVPEAYQFKPKEAGYPQSPLQIDQAELLTLESYPRQYVLVLKGYLPTPCHSLRLRLNGPDAQARLEVQAISVTDPDKLCAQVLEAFEARLPLGGLADGTYSVWVNGQQVGTISLP